MKRIAKPSVNLLMILTAILMVTSARATVIADKGCLVDPNCNHRLLSSQFEAVATPTCPESCPTGRCATYFGPPCTSRGGGVALMFPPEDNRKNREKEVDALNGNAE